jgi:hypothetical protein
MKRTLLALTLASSPTLAEESKPVATQGSSQGGEKSGAVHLEIVVNAEFESSLTKLRVTSPAAL